MRIEILKQRFSDSQLSRLWPLLAVVIVFYFFPYSAIDPSLRKADDYFTIYRRFGGMMSVWDFILTFAFVIYLSRAMITRNLKLSFGKPHSVIALLAFMSIAFAIGLLHVEGSVFGYGMTELKRPLIAFFPLLYFVAIYLLVINFIQMHESAQRFISWLIFLTVALCLYGVARLALILTGEVTTMWPFGLPIVLYDQMTMLYPLIFAVPALALIKKQKGEHIALSYWVLWFLAVFLIVCSARRFNYILLVGGLFLVLILGPILNMWRLRSSIKVVTKLSLLLSAIYFFLLITIPSFPRGVRQAISSINMMSKTGIEHGGDIRVAEIKNLWANMERRPYSYVIGMGVGTKWQEIEEQPLDSFTYPEEYVWSSKGWFPQFHLPYLALIYRFGILGFAALLGWMIFYTIQKSRRMPSLVDPSQKAIALSFLVFLLTNLTNIGDSANPTPTIMAGICIGLLDRLTGFTAE